MTEIQVPEYIPESERWAFSQLSPESQKVLLVHYQKSVANVMNDPKTWQNQVTENTEGTLTFWLTLAEKQSIEADINAGKPIMATPAYIKFLAAFLPNGLRVVDEKWKIFFSIDDIPEYEINNGTIYANYAGAVAIMVEWLSELFGRPVRLPAPAYAQKRILKHFHYAGQRFSYFGDLVWVGENAYAWVTEFPEGTCRFVYRFHEEGRAETGIGYPWDGLSLFPCFG